MLNTRIETAEEKKERVFQHYKNRLIKEVLPTFASPRTIIWCLFKATRFYFNYSMVYQICIYLEKDGD